MKTHIHIHVYSKKIWIWKSRKNGKQAAVRNEIKYCISKYIFKQFEVTGIYVPIFQIFFTSLFMTSFA